MPLRRSATRERRRAIDAAIAAQRQLTIAVRVGVATREAYETDGGYFGPVFRDQIAIVQRERAEHR
jgi:hypothetical protein